jgi:hypothetical protein
MMKSKNRRQREHRRSGAVVWRLLGLTFVLIVAGCGDGNRATTESGPTMGSATTSTLDELTDGDDYVAGADPDSLPVAAAPSGLGEVDLPDQVEDIKALFDRLPSDLIGRQRSDEPPGPDPGRINASYGSTDPVGCGTIGLQALDVSTGEFFPPTWTAETVIAIFTTGADQGTEEFGRDGDLFWVKTTITCGAEGSSGNDFLSVLSWGKRGSPWVFSATAGGTDRPEGRDELAAAFVAASS